MQHGLPVTLLGKRQPPRPDGETLNFAYDAAGRLSTLTIPTGEITYGYDAMTGNLNQAATSDGTTLAFTHDESACNGSELVGAGRREG